MWSVFVMLLPWQTLYDDIIKHKSGSYLVRSFCVDRRIAVSSNVCF